VACGSRESFENATELVLRRSPFVHLALLRSRCGGVEVIGVAQTGTRILEVCDDARCGLARALASEGWVVERASGSHLRSCCSIPRIRSRSCRCAPASALGAPWRSSCSA